MPSRSTETPLPETLPHPLRGALVHAGLTTLEAVAGRYCADLLALHGVGPKGIRMLRVELAARGMSLAD